MARGENHPDEIAPRGQVPADTARPLEYFSPTRRKKAPLPWYFDPPRDPELRNWWWRRITYFAGIGVLFASIAFYFGPNIILFQKLTRLAPQDFVPVVQARGVPAVRAIKMFERDHGRLPNDMNEIIPNYIAKDSFLGNYIPFEFATWGRGDSMITYTFTPGQEGWFVSGPFVSGRIPMPPVTIGPTSRPTTHPGS